MKSQWYTFIYNNEIETEGGEGEEEGQKKKKQVRIEIPSNCALLRRVAK